MPESHNPEKAAQMNFRCSLAFRKALVIIAAKREQKIEQLIVESLRRDLKIRERATA